MLKFVQCFSLTLSLAILAHDAASGQPAQPLPQTQPTSPLPDGEGWKRLRDQLDKRPPLDLTSFQAAVTKLQESRERRLSVAEDSGDKQGVLLTTKELGDRYKAGLPLITDMQASATTIKLIFQCLLIEQNLNGVSSVWFNDDLRKSYDRIRDWGSILGSAAGVIGVVVAATGVKSSESSGSNTQTVAGLSTLAGGAGLAGISQLIGALGGGQTGERFKKLAQQVDFSRQAYDDLRVRIDMTKTQSDFTADFIASAETFGTKYADLDQFKTTPGEVVERSELQKRALIELRSKYTELLKVVDQIGVLLQTYERTAERYKNSAISDEAKKVIQAKIAERLPDLKRNYSEKVRKFLTLERAAAEVFRNL